MVVCGLAFLVINLNLVDFYQLINQDGYASAIGVVVIVSLGKFFSMSMGCLNNIISNSQYYSYVFWFSISSAILAVLLNYYFINVYGIIGAALATFMVIVFINICKIILIYKVFKIHPYNKKSWSIVLSLFLIYGVIYLIPTMINPILSIIIRSVLIISLFAIPFYRFRWSEEIENQLKRLKALF